MATYWTDLLRSTRNSGQTDYSSSTLDGCDATKMNLTGCNFSNSSMVGMILRGADLTASNFAGATVTGADFSDALLLGCPGLTGAMLASATTNAATRTDGSLGDPGSWASASDGA